MTKIEADNIISHYYPDYLTLDELETKYTQTKEYKNLTEKCNEAKFKLETWKEIIKEIRERLPENFNVSDWTHLFRNEPCYRLRIGYPTIETIPNRIRELMLNVSVLVDYFSIYLSEQDFNPIDKRYSLPIIGFKNNYGTQYLLIEPPQGSIELQEHFLISTTKEFINEKPELDKIVFHTITTTISKYFPTHKPLELEFILEVTDNFTNGNKLMGETTYFDCFFSDHIF